MPRWRRLSVTVFVLVTLVASGCSDGDTVEAGEATTTSGPPPTTAEAAEPATSMPTTTVVSDDDAETATMRPSGAISTRSTAAGCAARLDDVCDGDYDVTVIAADGSRTIEEFTPAEDPPVDCFYAYPTVAFDEAGNADIDDADNNAEEGVAANQLARFGEVCRHLRTAVPPGHARRHHRLARRRPRSRLRRRRRLVPSLHGPVERRAALRPHRTLPGFGSPQADDHRARSTRTPGSASRWCRRCSSASA